jgi:gliding motility-associated-like protein
MYEEPGLYTIQLDMVFPFGCQYSEDFPLVRILEGPSTDFAFSPDNSTNFEPQVHFTDLSLNADRWFWDFGGVGTSTLQNPSFDFPDTGLFQVKLTSFHPTTNCPDTITRTVDIMPAVMLQLPNAFTPNNDAKNDFFTVSGSFDGLFDYNMSIWNRWGEKVYETTDIRIGWNGLKNNSGEESPQGIYVYKVIYSTGRGDRQVQEGHVTLLR